MARQADGGGGLSLRSRRRLPGVRRGHDARPASVRRLSAMPVNGEPLPLFGQEAGADKVLSDGLHKPLCGPKRVFCRFERHGLYVL